MGYNKGDTYEEKIFDIFKNKGLLKPGTLRAGAGGKPDIMFLHNGKEYNLEAKENQGADYGQKYLKWENDKLVWRVDDSTTKLYTKCGVLNFVNEVNRARKFPINKIIKNDLEITRMDNKEDQNFFDMKFKIPQSNNLLAQFYNEKDVHYIQIGTHSIVPDGKKTGKKTPCGFYHLGSDPANLGTTEFDGYMLIRLRAKVIRSEPPSNYNLTSVLKYFPSIKNSTMSKFNIEENTGQEFPPIKP